MKRFVEGADRSQITLFPECLEDWIDDDNPVRVIDVFVDELDLAVLGFSGVDPEVTGRPSYHPAILLKLYIYCCLNRVQSSRLKEKIAKLKEEMQRLRALEARMLATPDQQISLTDPDARSMATSGRGSGVVGYNVQIAVETKHHLIITHEVTNVGSDRSQLSSMAKAAKATLEVEKLDAVADRGYFNSEEILACDNAGITVT